MAEELPELPELGDLYDLFGSVDTKTIFVCKTQKEKDLLTSCGMTCVILVNIIPIHTNTSANKDIKNSVSSRMMRYIKNPNGTRAVANNVVSKPDSGFCYDCNRYIKNCSHRKIIF